MNLPRFILITVAVLGIAPLLCAADADQHPGTLSTPKQEIPALREARQLILVITADWHSVQGELTRYERSKPTGPWQPVAPKTPVVVGRSGLAWGIGLHSEKPAAERPKKEGDGKGPAGVFALLEVFGYASAPDAGIGKFPYRALTPNTEGVDDPKSRSYNRIVEHAPGAPKDWDSAEQMRRDDELYRWGVVVGHNEAPFPGAGSCIFLHLWEGPTKGTAGCTAMAAAQIEELVHWLDAAKKPLLVQLPRGEYERLKVPWALP